MDLTESLEKATKRILQLEQELAQWQNKELANMSAEELADNVYKQQIETLTFHLLKGRQQVEELTKRNLADGQEIHEALTEISNLHRELEIKAEIIDKLKKLSELKREIQAAEDKKAETATAKQPSDADYIKSFQQAKPSGAVFDVQVAPKKPKTIKNFIDLMSRLDRVKLLDASILLDVSPDAIEEWASTLEGKGLVLVEGTDRDKKTLFATENIKRLK